jgi:predicted transcriptional regulator
MEAGIVTIEQRGGRHGIQKVCRVRDERILIESPIKRPSLHIYEAELDVGQFVDCQASSPCGIAITERLLEPQDDPSGFSNPERLKAGLLWMKSGYLEYPVPNFIKENQTLTEIQISMELSPDAPDPLQREASELYLWLNNKEVATFTLPKEEGNAYGMFNPTWWTDSRNQRGTYKLITINDTGAYADGIQISQVKLSDLKIGAAKSIPLRLGASEDAANNSGFTLFGFSFGNYPQGIKVRMVYEE